MSRMTRFLVGGVEMNAREIIDYAEYQYACQADEALKLTSVAAQELKRHGIQVEVIKERHNEQ